ncbi:MAG TPA: heavy metal transporter, partial [Spirochaetia bacterium]|nr:heavy metal transporter [Spirochaetia bacterium]
GAIPSGFVGGAIPTDAIGIAPVRGDSQVVDIAVDQAGYTPAVVVLQRGLKAKIRFTPRNLTTCNSVVTFPEYQGSLCLQNGELETPYLEVTQDFGFQCGMGMLHGYAKVVDDIRHVDLNQVRKTVAAYRPASIGGASCCGR